MGLFQLDRPKTSRSNKMSMNEPYHTSKDKASYNIVLYITWIISNNMSSKEWAVFVFIQW